MNKNNYVLHNKWRMIKKLIQKNINNLINIGVALSILFIVMFAPSIEKKEVIESSTKLFDSYSNNISKEDKINYILEKYNLSKYQFDVLSAIVLTEAESNSYDDA